MNHYLRRLTVGLLAVALAFASVLGGRPGPVSAVVGVVTLNTPHNENFAGLSSSGTSNPWVNDITINGWYSTQSTYRASDGSDAIGGLYSFGTSADRALGSIATPSTGTNYFGIRLRNNTGGNIQYFYVAYSGEQWRRGGSGAPQSLAFGYQFATTVTQIDKGTWDAVPALNFTSPNPAGAAGPLDGNSASNRLQYSAYITLSSPLSPGDEIMFRWADIDDRGNDDGLAVDDLVIIPYFFSPTAVSWALSSLDVSQTAAQDGSPLSYRIVVADAEGGAFALSDTFDPRLAIVSAPGMAINGQTVSASGVVAPGERRAYTVTVQVRAGASGAIGNSAVIDGGGSSRTLEAPPVAIGAQARN